MQNKKVIGITLAGLITGITIAAGIFLLVANVNRQETVRPGVEGDVIGLTPTPVLPSVSKRTYENESGFLFKHPADISIEENELDSASYADLTLISTRADGSLTFTIADSEMTTIDEWVDSLDPTPQPETISSISLDDISGKQIELENSITTGALDQGALIVIEVSSDEQFSYWKSVYQMILETFEFVAPESPPPASSGSSSGGGDIIFEGEEIIE